MATESTTKDKSVDLETMRHSFAHVLAMATLRLYPEARLGIGPATKYGFYYEFEFPKKITQDDLPKIEQEMQKIIAEEIPFKQIMVEREQAFNTLVQLGQIYKTELLQAINDQQISFYKTGESFIDMCRGPHLAHTGELGVFKLTKVSDVHWFGDNSRPTLQKIEGVGFATAEQLVEYEQKMENLKMRDHRRQGKSLSLFLEAKENDSENIYWIAKGAELRTVIQKTINTWLLDANYTAVETPLLTNGKIRTTTLDGTYEIFKSKRRSYKELPVRFFENGIIQKEKGDEPSYGLYDSLVRNTTATVTFCAPHDLVNQLASVIETTKNIYDDLGLSIIKVELCVPDLSGITLGDKEKKTLNDYFQLIKSTMVESEIDFDMSTKKPFIYYAPYVSFVVQDMHEREWEIGKFTIVYDPKKTNPSVTNSRNNPEKTVAIYNELIISYERLIAYLLESTDGALPLWMAPIQVDLLSLSEKYNQYVTQLYSELLKEGIRCSVHTSNETIQTKIRRSQMQKTPYMLIIGEKEIKTNSVSLRNRDGQELGLIRIDEFIAKLKAESNIEKVINV